MRTAPSDEVKHHAAVPASWSRGRKETFKSPPLLFAHVMQTSKLQKSPSVQSVIIQGQSVQLQKLLGIPVNVDLSDLAFNVYFDLMH
jgi:hypothetical protein